MIFNHYIIKDLPVVVIDNYYDKDAEEKIWREIQFYSNDDKMLLPEHTGSAFTKDDGGNKVYKKQNKGLYLDDVYSNRNVSDILRENRKLWYPEFTEKLIEIHTFFRYLNICNSDSTLLSYYEDSDYYHPHHDDSLVTTCTWFYKQPKRFNGGDLIIENELRVACEYNRTVIFPSILIHEVEKVELSSEDKNKNFGRYTLTQLSNYK